MGCDYANGHSPEPGAWLNFKASFAHSITKQFMNSSFPICASQKLHAKPAYNSASRCNPTRVQRGSLRHRTWKLRARLLLQTRAVDRHMDGAEEIGGSAGCSLVYKNDTLTPSYTDINKDGYTSNRCSAALCPG